MKLFDKIKDLFMDEVIEDDEIELEEEEKKEYQEPPKSVLPKVMRETIKEEEKEEKVELKVKPEEFIKSFSREELKEEMKEKKEEKKDKEPEKPKEIVPPTKKFSFPIEFDEDEIPTRKSSNINVLNLEKEPPKKVSILYPEKEEDTSKSKFRATPVISPVYGILDKNYTKEEVKERDEEMVEIKRPSKKVDFETVRKKAFGNLADEIKDNLMCENCELYKEVKKLSALKEDDLLYDMTVEDDKGKDEEVTIEKAYDNYRDFGVAYEPKPAKKKAVPEEVEEEEKSVNEDDVKLEEIIKNSQKIEKSYDEEETIDVSEKPDLIYTDKVEEVIVEEVVPEKENEESIPSRSEKKNDTKVDADFFELIDSMYKERADE